MTECPRDILHSKVWRSAPSCTRLCHCRQSRPSCHYQAQVRPSLYVGQLREKTGDTGDAALKFFGDTGDATLSTHLELQRMCARRKMCCSLNLSTPCSWESSASTNPWTSLLLGTQGHHRLVERGRSALLSTPCRRKTSSDHAVNDDI